MISALPSPEPNPNLLDPSQDPINEAAAKILRAPTPQEQKSAPTATSKIQVLLTEDNIINQRLLQRQLIKAGFTVPVANNGLEALEFVRKSTITSSTSDITLDCILMGEFRETSCVPFVQRQLNAVDLGDRYRNA